MQVTAITAIGVSLSGTAFFAGVRLRVGTAHISSR